MWTKIPNVGSDFFWSVARIARWHSQHAREVSFSNVSSSKPSNTTCTSFKFRATFGIWRVLCRASLAMPNAFDVAAFLTHAILCVECLAEQSGLSKEEARDAVGRLGARVTIHIGRCDACHGAKPVLAAA